MGVLASYLWAPPWAWFSDPPWMIVGNVLFWPCYVAWLYLGDWRDERRKRLKWERGRAG